MTGQGEQFTPAFDGQRPPFAPGNAAALTHGSYSTLQTAARATELADEIRAAAPVYESCDEPAVRLAGLLLARVERAAAALAAVDEMTAAAPLAAYLTDEGDRLARLRVDARQWINSTVKLLDALAMTPTSRARLGLDIARTGDALADLAAEGRRIRLSREGGGDE